MFSDKPLHARTQCAHAAHDEVDLHPGLRCFVQRHDGLGFEQRVHLGDDVRLFARLGQFGLVADRLQYFAVQGERRLPQMVATSSPCPSR